MPQVGLIREVAVHRAIKAEGAVNERLHPLELYSPRSYCEERAGLPAEEVDCISGRRLEDLVLTLSSDSEAADQKAAAQVAELLVRHEVLLDFFERQRGAEPALQPVVFALRARIGDLKGALKHMDAPAHGESWFRTLLTAQGVRYDPVGNRFRSVGWDVARLAENPLVVATKGRQMELLVNSLVPAWALSVTILLVFAWHQAGAAGLAVAAFTTILLAIGTALITSASANFGMGHPSFALNPLRNQAPSHAVYILIFVGLILTIVRLRGVCLWIARWTLVHPGITAAVVALAVVLTYAARGPAVGSEALKCATCLVCATLTAGYARLTHTVRSLGLSAAHLLSTLSARDAASVAIRRGMVLPVLHAFTAVFATIALVAIIFSDLGGALVALLITTAAVMVLLGLRAAMILTTLIAGVGLLLLQTDKLQARMSLMRDPWTAPISDFARLDAFSRSAGTWGYGIADLPWCSESGSCLPVQVLSDYIPTLLTGALGLTVSVSIFLVVCAGFGLWAFWLARAYVLARRGGFQVLALTAFYLLVASEVQTIITFLGNWRVIPLTGLGAPLLSLGLSSMASPFIALLISLLLGRLETFGDGGDEL